MYLSADLPAVGAYFWSLRVGTAPIPVTVRFWDAAAASICTKGGGYRTICPMATMPVSEAREKLSEAVETARTEAVFLERYGRPAAVIVSTERYEELVEALEEVEDIAAFDAAMAEEDESIPWEQVKIDLGWV